MTRSVFRPVRTRRVLRAGAAQLLDLEPGTGSPTPGTRKTLAAIGALWVSFAVTASGAPPAPAGATRTAGADLTSTAR
jgi:hypothetical protein